MWFSKKIRRLNTALTVFIGSLLMLGGIATALSDPIVEGSFLAVVLTSKISLVIFGGFFFILGATVIYALFAKRKKLYSNILLAIYLLCFFTAILELVIAPGAAAWIDNAIIAGICGYLWLWWKNITEYIDLKHFHIESTTINFDEKDDS